MIYDNVLEAIGHTPMIRLNKMPEEGSSCRRGKFSPGSVAVGRDACKDVSGGRSRHRKDPVRAVNFSAA